MEGIMARKDLDEKLKEARETIVWASELPIEYRAESLEGAGYFLLGEVDRLRKIEDGLEKLIAMRKQVIGLLTEEIEGAKAQEYYYGTNGVHELTAKVATITGEVWPLEALLDGE